MVPADLLTELSLSMGSEENHALASRLFTAGDGGTLIDLLIKRAALLGVRPALTLTRCY